jgi:AraC-like DNA-binding protein
MILQIKNMQSERCKIVVKNELNKLGLPFKKVELGKAVLKENISMEYLQLIDIALKEAGLQLMDDKKNLLIEKIKDAIYQLVRLPNDLPKPRFSDYISMKCNSHYTYLSNLFSGILGITIEKYIILQKVEFVKELLLYTKQSLSDIAFALQYSSVAHLSNQFKKVTGLTPSFFKQNRLASLRIA